jgi:hypothetical protein
MSEQSPEPLVAHQEPEQEPEQSTVNTNPSPQELQYDLIPAQVVEGEVVIDPKVASELEKAPQVYLAVTKNTSVNTTVRAISYSGGFPPSEFMETAEKYYPGAVKEVFDGFEKERNHRYGQENRAQRAEINLAYIGISIGGFLVASSVLGSLYMFMTGNIHGGTAALGLTGIIGLFGYFIRLSRTKPEDLYKVQEPKTQPQTAAQKTARQQRPAQQQSAQQRPPQQRPVQQRPVQQRNRQAPRR